MLIYILEDDKAISYIIEKTVNNAGYLSKTFNRSELLLKTIYEETPDLLLLDIMMPDISGIEVLKKVRPFFKDLPIIMISALGTEMDKVLALDLGADDYMTKPFGVLELTSRINLQLRKKQVDLIYNYENLKLNYHARKCFINDEEISLTVKEFDILYHLLKSNGQVVTKEFLFNEVWKMDASIETRTLDMHMKSLRQKIKDANLEIKTVRGIGFQIWKKDYLFYCWV